MADEPFGPMSTFSTESTDVAPVTSLTDRRKIRDLEAKTADLERKLQEALGRVKPALEHANTAKDADGTCYHSGTFLVSDNEDTVTCKDCGAIISPFVVLRRLSHREVNFCYTLNSLRGERSALEKAVEKLKGQKSRLKTAVRKGSDPPVQQIEAFAREFELLAIGVQWIYGGVELVARTKALKEFRAVGEDVPQAFEHLRILLARKEPVTAPR
jgi:hypothetical protein